MFQSPAPDEVRAEVEAYLDRYSRSLDKGLSAYFKLDPIGLDESSETQEERDGNLR